MNGSAILPRSRGRTACHVLLAVLAALAGACAAAPPARSAPIPPSLPLPGDARAVLDEGDILSVVIHGHPDLSSGELGLRVDPAGEVDLPLLGPVAVAGLSIVGAREAIQTRAARYVRSPAVAVSVLEYAPRPFYVLGAVRAGGRMPLEEPLTALAALSMAGGFDEGADLERVALLRVAGGELVVHFFDAATPGVDGLVGVAPGDLLFVRRSGARTFREEIEPYLQGFSAPLHTLATLVLVTDRLNE
ncbi:MAG: polysaccharide biosynthesis/export family protein [Planctomycetota bacterium]